MVHSAALSATAKNRQNLMMSEEELISYRIGCRAGKQELRHPAEDQAGVEKLEIGTETDSHDPEIIKGNSNQIIGVGIPPRKPQQLQDKETS